MVVSQGPVWERQVDVMDFINHQRIRDTCETQRYPGLILGPQIQRVGRWGWECLILTGSPVIWVLSRA